MHPSVRVDAPELLDRLGKDVVDDGHELVVTTACDEEEHLLGEVLFEAHETPVFRLEDVRRRRGWRECLGLLQLVEHVANKVFREVARHCLCEWRVRLRLVHKPQLVRNAFDLHGGIECAVLVHRPAPALRRRRHAVIGRRDQVAEARRGRIE